MDHFNTDIAFKIWIRGIFHPTWMIKLNQIRIEANNVQKPEFHAPHEGAYFLKRSTASHDLIFPIYFVDLFIGICRINRYGRIFFTCFLLQAL